MINLYKCRKNTTQSLKNLWKVLLLLEEGIKEHRNPIIIEKLTAGRPISTNSHMELKDPPKKIFSSSIKIIDIARILEILLESRMKMKEGGLERTMERSGGKKRRGVSRKE